MKYILIDSIYLFHLIILFSKYSLLPTINKLNIVKNIV